MGFASGKQHCQFAPGLCSFTLHPPGMKLIHRDLETDEWDTSTGMKFNKRLPKNPDTWNMSSHSLRVHRKPDAGAPETWEYAVHYPKAEQRERILADTNTKDPKAYVLASNKSTTIPVTACICLRQVPSRTPLMFQTMQSFMENWSSSHQKQPIRLCTLMEPR